jgi:hypothetical protein
MRHDVRYDACAAVTAQIVNLHLGSKEPAAIVFGKILFLILDAMKEVEHERAIRLEPSEN